MPLMSPLKILSLLQIDDMSLPEDDGKSKKQVKDAQSPSPLLTAKEIEEGDKAFVELVKARDKMIAAAKRSKGIPEADY